MLVVQLETFSPNIHWSQEHGHQSGEVAHKKRTYFLRFPIEKSSLVCGFDFAVTDAVGTSYGGIL